jgi:hypothetical protein
VDGGYSVFANLIYHFYSKSTFAMEWYEMMGHVSVT